MRGPRLGLDHPDRWLECQEDLEEAFVTLIERGRTAFVDLLAIERDLTEAALAVGWRQEEISPAIADLAVNYQLRIAAARETDIDIAAALAAMRRH